MQTTQIEPLLDIHDIARITRLGPSRIYQFLRTGQLRRVILPDCDRILVAPDELRRFIGQRQADPSK